MGIWQLSLKIKKKQQQNKTKRNRMNHSCLVTGDIALLLPHSFREVQRNGSSNHLMFFHRIWIWFPKANTHLNRQSCLLDSAHTWQPRDPHTQTTGKTFGDKENPGFLIIQMEPQKCQDHTVNQNYLQADTADICIERIEWWEMISKVAHHNLKKVESQLGIVVRNT